MIYTAPRDKEKELLTKKRNTVNMPDLKNESKTDMQKT